jgi:hypothetical protein
MEITLRGKIANFERKRGRRGEKLPKDNNIQLKD